MQICTIVDELMVHFREVKLHIDWITIVLSERKV